jgi:hypothetical protein
MDFSKVSTLFLVELWEARLKKFKHGVIYYISLSLLFGLVNVSNSILYTDIYNMFKYNVYRLANAHARKTMVTFTLWFNTGSTKMQNRELVRRLVLK